MAAATGSDHPVITAPRGASVDVSKRALSGLHSGLLAVGLVGLIAPSALEPTLRSQLKATYTLAVQRELEAAGEQVAYEQIQRRFTMSNAALPPVGPLAAISRFIASAPPPRQGSKEATSTELDVARRR